MKVSKILVPIDFSPCADNALHAAIHLAKRMNASLMVYHAIEAAIYNEAAEAFYDAADEENRAENAFNRLRDRMPELSEVSHELHSTVGPIIDEISGLVKAIRPDLVIMGTKGVSGVYEVLLGSTAYQVMRSLPIPVLVIPENSNVEKITSIALAGDYKPIQPEVLNPIKMMTELDGADIHVVHISGDESLNEDQVSEARKINRYLKNYRHHYHLISSDDVETGLQEYCDKNEIDILAMIPRKHNLFDRIFDSGDTKTMIFHAKIPILAIPETL